MQLLAGMGLILLGVVMIVARRRYMEMAIRFQNRLWGFSFGNREQKWSEWGSAAVGVGFVGVGIALISGVVEVW